MEIKILGGGCPKCNRLEKMARDAAAEAGVEPTFIKVKDMNAIAAYGVAFTPALVIDEEVKSAGKLPRQEEIATWIREAAG